MAIILPRNSWTSAKNGRAGRSLDPSRVTGITLHWPTGFSTMLDDTQAQVAGRLRGWRAEHVAKTWADIGYNYAVDGSGRKWNLTGNNVGAHAGGKPSGNSTIGNLTTVGVLLVLGQGEKPNAAMIQGVKELHTELRKTLTKATRTYGHRDWVGTECPGAAVYAAIKAGAFSGKPKPTAPQDLMEEIIMSTAAEREAFAKQVAKEVWAYGLASRTEGVSKGVRFPAGTHLAANNANVWGMTGQITLILAGVLASRGTPLTAAEIEAAVKAALDATIDTATVNLNINQ